MSKDIIKHFLHNFNLNNNLQVSIPKNIHQNNSFYNLTHLYTKSIILHKKPSFFYNTNLELFTSQVIISKLQNIPIDGEYIYFNYKYDNILNNIYKNKPIFIDIKNEQFENYGYITHLCNIHSKKHL